MMHLLPYICPDKVKLNSCGSLLGIVIHPFHVGIYKESIFSDDDKGFVMKWIRNTKKKSIIYKASLTCLLGIYTKQNVTYSANSREMLRIFCFIFLFFVLCFFACLCFFSVS